MGSRLIQLSGHDATSTAFNLEGGDGTISVISNVAPAQMVAIHNACKRNDGCSARSLAFALKPLLTALEQDTNPVPIKYALHRARGLSQDVRLPLVVANDETAASIRRAIAALDPDAHPIAALRDPDGNSRKQLAVVPR
jgi:4-hydroxy-tetrahydrodipicolinate synthase